MSLILVVIGGVGFGTGAFFLERLINHLKGGITMGSKKSKVVEQATQPTKTPAEMLVIGGNSRIGGRISVGFHKNSVKNACLADKFVRRKRC